MKSDLFSIKPLSLLILDTVLSIVVVGTAHAAVRYVNVNNLEPSPPYTTWATAATVIQDAIDTAENGEEIIVTNGVYQAGGQVVTGSMTNRVAVTKRLLLRSVNGPEVTMIQGRQVSGTTNGDGAVRCVYLARGATLIGFTLTNGATLNSGPLLEQSGGGALCESDVVISNCVVSGNSAASHGGGIRLGALNDCVLTGNSASVGGAVWGSVLNSCTLSGNSAQMGGGADGCVLTNCRLSGNSAQEGGGASYSVVDSCTVSGNVAGSGGGTAYGIIYNCALTGNSAQENGGGAYRGRLYNCTISGNFARSSGGGTYESEANNCIVYYNIADASGDNYSDKAALNYCCTTPLPPSGVGNLIAEPQLTSAYQLSAASPCRGTGSPEYANGTDLNGEPWANPPSIGCDEPVAGAETGPLTVAIQVSSSTTFATGFTLSLTARIQGSPSVSYWDFGDGTVVSNRPYATHSWQAAGDYSVVLHAYNQDNPGEVRAMVTVHVIAQPRHYVAVRSTNPMPPYDSWTTAATNIQDAVDAAILGGSVLVSNGVYETGGRVVTGVLTNRVVVTRPLILSSVNGPAVTVIRGFHVPETMTGDGAVRCVYLAKGAMLMGFSLTNGSTLASGHADVDQSGGGVWCESVSAVVSNCVLIGNWAKSSGGGAYNGALIGCTFKDNSAGLYGGGVARASLSRCVLATNWCGYAAGGAAFGTLNNCAFIGNASIYGGGVHDATLNNCTLTGNSAYYGGGIFFGTLNNCIIYYNRAAHDPNYYGCSLSYCCSTPLPSTDRTNFTEAPLFVDSEIGDLQLQSESPCINSGFKGYAPAGADQGGNPRLVGGEVDVGAYEFQSPSSTISYVWLQRHNLPTDGSADYADQDADTMDNWHEWRADTDPTNKLSVLRLFPPSLTSSATTVTWNSVSTRSYAVDRSTNLGGVPVFLPWRSNILGQVGTSSCVDTNVGGGAVYYRVGVR